MSDAERLAGAEAIGEAIREAQVIGRVEYKRRVGYHGRLSLARAVLASDWLAAHDAEVAARARREALTEAADAWQQGEWADAPRRDDPVVERIANGNFVHNWLRARTEREGGQ